MTRVFINHPLRDAALARVVVAAIRAGR